MGDSSFVVTTMPHRRRPRSWADRYLFVTLFLVGAGVMLAFKALGAGQLLVTLGPVSAMAVYAGYVVWSPRHKIRSDEAGDSLYYLGFLFTMVSLASSLYEFSTSGGATQQIVTNFGIALVTTILGLMARVAFHQLREDPFDVEQEVRIDLAEASAQLKGRVLQAIGDFDTLRVAITQSVSEATDAATRRSLAAMAASVAAHEKALAGLSAAVEAATSEIGDQKTAMVAAGKHVAGAVERLGDRLEKASLPMDAINEAVDQLRAGIARMTIAVSEGTTQAKTGSDELSRSLFLGAGVANDLKDQFALLREVTAEYHKGVQRSTAEMEAAAKTLADLSGRLLKQADTAAAAYEAEFRRMSKAATEANELADATRRRLNSDLKTSADSVTQVHDSIVSMSRVLVSKLDAQQRRR